MHTLLLYVSTENSQNMCLYRFIIKTFLLWEPYREFSTLKVHVGNRYAE